MPQPSQYQARRLLELVSLNHAKAAATDHVERDHWARTHPPLRGLIFEDRETARHNLYTGNLCAVPAVPAVTAAALPAVLPQPQPPLADVDKGNLTLPLQNRNVQPLPRVESSASKMSKVSSVPSFGKIHEPLSGSSVQLDDPHHQHLNQTSDPKRITRITPAEYEEFGSEALITNVYDDVEEEFDDATPSALFRQIGPSISMAHGIHDNNPSYHNSFPPRDTQVYRGENIHIVDQQSPHTSPLKPASPSEKPPSPPPQPSPLPDQNSQPSIQPQTAPSEPPSYPSPTPATQPDNSFQPPAEPHLQPDAVFERSQQSAVPMSPPFQIGELRGETGKIATPPPPPPPRVPLPPPVPKSNNVPSPPPPPPPVADVHSYGEPAVPPPPSRPPPPTTSMHEYRASSDQSAFRPSRHDAQHDGSVEYEGEVEQYDYSATDAKDLNLHDIHRREDHRFTGEIAAAIVGHE